MEQRNNFELQIERLGKFLSQMIAQIIKKEGTFETKSQLEETKIILKSDHGIDFDKLKGLTSENFIATFQNNSSFNHLNMEYMADLISLVAESESNTIDKHHYLAKSLAIYLYLDRIQRTYSEERDKKIMRIKNTLEI